MAAGGLRRWPSPITWRCSSSAAPSAPEDTARVAVAARRSSSSRLPSWVTIQVAGRAFYAREDMWRPMLLGTAIAVMAIPLYRELGGRFGGEGLAAAGALAMTLNAVALLVMLRGVHGGPPVVPLVSTLARALVVAALGAWLARTAADLSSAALASFLLGTAAFGIVAIPGIWWFGDEAVREVLRRVAGRLGRGRG